MPSHYTLTATDNVISPNVYLRTVSDTIAAPTDSVSRIVGSSRAASDTLSAISDSVARVLGSVLNTLDNVTSFTDFH